MATLSRYEQETIILFNEEDDHAECYTHNRKLTNRLKKLCKERSDEIEEIRDNCVGGLTFVFPKSWVKVNPKRIVSEERRAEMAARLAESLSANSNG